MELAVGNTNSDTSLAELWFSSDTSNGYLEDAITLWGVGFKRQNSPSYSHSQECQDLEEMPCLNDQVDLFPTCSSSITQLLDDSENLNSSSHSSSQNDVQAAATTKQDGTSRKSDNEDAAVSKGESQRKKMAYPFEMVKRGGVEVEGEIALEDINQKMIMRPAKAIPHPVGDCVDPPCVSARGFGISGKEVVAVTRIHTQGRGSIIIVRTKG